jgi:hypothetical protein
MSIGKNKKILKKQFAHIFENITTMEAYHNSPHPCFARPLPKGEEIFTSPLPFGERDG